MSSKFKVLSIALVALLALGAFTAVTKADVTGSFTTGINITPTGTQTHEAQSLIFDIENNINLTVVISGLSTTIHSHFGLAGVEDVVLTLSATLGALDINDVMVFGRFAGHCAAGYAVGPNCYYVVNDTAPQTDALVFIKKRVTASISLGGVTFSNLAIFEDTNKNQDPWVMTPNFGFGDVVSLSGQTPSGVTVGATTGICASQTPNVIKKHWWPYAVNPDCSNPDNLIGGVKPPLGFDFEDLTISGVPIAAGVTGSSELYCEHTTACSLTSTIAFSGGPIPFKTSFSFTDLFTLSMGKTTLTLSTGAGTLTIAVLPDGTIGAVGLDLATTLNPDTNPATLSISADITPGVGLTDATVGLEINRGGIDFSIAADFGSGPPAEFQDVVFGVSTSLGSIDVSTQAVFGAFGFVSSSTSLTLNF